MTAGPQLHTLHVGDAASAWSRAGFAVAEPTGAAPHSVLLGAVRVLLHGDGGPRGLLRWDLVSHAAGLPTQGTINAADIDGLPTAWVPDEPTDEVAEVAEDARTSVPGHHNGVTGLDHLVIGSPHVQRTTAALLGAGFEARRTRDTDGDGEAMRQVFFWAGPVIVELVGPADVGAAAASPDAPAAFFGLALNSGDLDDTAARLGELLGPPRPAVQSGRRIATLRFKAVGGSVPTVVMSPHLTSSG